MKNPFLLATLSALLLALLQVTALAEKLTVFSMNDLHGNTEAKILKTKEGREFKRGGAEIISAYYKIARESGGNVLLLNAGDQFQGTMTSNMSKGVSVTRFMNSVGVTASTLGNHEFDYGGTKADPVAVLKSRIADARFPYVVANIRDRKTGKLPAWKNLYEYRIIKTGNLKVGITGLSTVTTPTTTKPEYVRNLEFLPYKESLERVVPEMRKKGADLVIVVAHLGSICRGPEAESCDLNEKDAELLDLTKSLEKGYVDLIVSGHTHTILRHEFNGIPVIQAGGGGDYLGYAELNYSAKDGRITKDSSVTQAPVPLCWNFIGTTGTCDKNAPGDLLPATWRGKEIKPDESMVKLMRPFRDSVEKAKKRIVGEAAREISKNPDDAENAMGDLIADALVASVKGAPIAIVNNGGVRGSFDKGPITYGDVFRVQPFDNLVVKATIKGKNLIEMVRIGVSGAHRILSVAGLRITYDPAADPDIAEDMDGDSKKSPWERNRLVSVTLADGSMIDPAAEYTIVTNDFITGGGDDFAWALRENKPGSFKPVFGLFLRDALEKYIKGLKNPINTDTRPIMDPKTSRIIIAGKQ